MWYSANGSLCDQFYESQNQCKSKKDRRLKQVHVNVMQVLEKTEKKLQKVDVYSYFNDPLHEIILLQLQ